MAKGKKSSNMLQLKTVTALTVLNEEGLKQQEAKAFEFRNEVYASYNQLMRQLNTGVGSSEFNRSVAVTIEKIKQYETAIDTYDKQLQQQAKTSVTYAHSIHELRAQLLLQQQDILKDIAAPLAGSELVSPENKEALKGLETIAKNYNQQLDNIDETLRKNKVDDKSLREKQMEVDDFGAINEISEKGPFNSNDIKDIEAHYVASYEILLQTYISLRVLSQTSNPELKEAVTHLEKILVQTQQIHNEDFNPEKNYHLSQQLVAVNKYAANMLGLLRTKDSNVYLVGSASKEFKESEAAFKKFTLNFQHKAPTLFKLFKAELYAFAAEVAKGISSIISALGSDKQLQQASKSLEAKSLTFKHNAERLRAGGAKEAIKIGEAMQDKELYQQLTELQRAGNELRRDVESNAFAKPYIEAINFAKNYENAPVSEERYMKDFLQQLANKANHDVLEGRVEADVAAEIVGFSMVFAKSAMQQQNLSQDEISQMQGIYTSKISQIISKMDSNIVDVSGYNNIITMISNNAGFLMESQADIYKIGEATENANEEKSAAKTKKATASDIKGLDIELKELQSSHRAFKLYVKRLSDDLILSKQDAFKLIVDSNELYQAAVDRAVSAQQGKTAAEINPVKSNYQDSLYDHGINKVSEKGGKMALTLFNLGNAFETAATDLVDKAKPESNRKLTK